MDLTRRAVTAAALALPVAAQARPNSPRYRPVVIAHRGASGERPEETRAAYDLAIDEGCDFIEPDLVVTKDGHLVARHENEIGATTDVAAHPEFAARKTTKVIDGEKVTGWFTEDFTLAEIKTLRCRERLPQLRPDNTKYDGQDPILTFDEVVAIAQAGSKRAGRTIGVYPEMKHPTHFASVGLPIEGRMALALRRNHLDSATAPVFVQCFEVGALKAIRSKTRARLIQLIDAEGGPADLPGVRYADMIAPAGLKAIAAYADGIGPHQGLAVDLKAAGGPVPTRLVAGAHAVGLKVHTWTARAENAFLPPSLQEGPKDSPDFLRRHGRIEGLYAALFAAGVDGLFSDFPGLAVKARAAFQA